MCLRGSIITLVTVIRYLNSFSQFCKTFTGSYKIVYSRMCSGLSIGHWPLLSQ